MRERASGASICPSGVRRKMASGAGQAPRSWMTLVWSPLLAAISASATLVRSMAEREPAEARSSSSRMWARTRARNSLSSYDSPTPSWEEGEAGDAALDVEAAEAVAVERGQEQVADADVELEGLHVGVPLRRGGHGVVGEQGADEPVAEVGQREALDVGVALVLAGGGDHEVDEGVVRVAPVDGEVAVRDARPRDHREQQGAKNASGRRCRTGPGSLDPISDALEPPVGAHRVEREDAFPGHILGPRLARRARAVIFVVRGRAFVKAQRRQP